MNSFHKDDVCDVIKTGNGIYRAVNWEGDFLEDVVVKFQNGSPVVGQNGLTLEAVIAITIDRLEQYNQGDFKCNHNDLALEHLKAAKLALELRITERKERGVYDTQKA